MNNIIIVIYVQAVARRSPALVLKRGLPMSNGCLWNYYRNIRIPLACYDYESPLSRAGPSVKSADVCCIRGRLQGQWCALWVVQRITGAWAVGKPLQEWRQMVFGHLLCLYGQNTPKWSAAWQGRHGGVGTIGRKPTWGGRSNHLPGWGTASAGNATVQGFWGGSNSGCFHPSLLLPPPSNPTLMWATSLLSNEAMEQTIPCALPNLEVQNFQFYLGTAQTKEFVHTVPVNKTVWMFSFSVWLN